MGTLFRPLRLLLLNSSEAEGRRIVSELHRNGHAVLCQRVETLAALQDQLCRPSWDIVLSDGVLPNFTALEALHLLQTAGLDVPFIVLFDCFEGKDAIEVIKAGAHNCLLKENLEQLSSLVVQELQALDIRRQTRRTETTLLQLMAQSITEYPLNNEAISELVSLLNHELRTPLTSIQASIELLKTGQLGTLSERGQHLLEIAARNTERLVQVTERVLELEALTSSANGLSDLREAVRGR